MSLDLSQYQKPVYIIDGIQFDSEEEAQNYLNSKNTANFTYYAQCYDRNGQPLVWETYDKDSEITEVGHIPEGTRYLYIRKLIDVKKEETELPSDAELIPGEDDEDTQNAIEAAKEITDDNSQLEAQWKYYLPKYIQDYPNLKSGDWFVQDKAIKTIYEEVGVISGLLQDNQLDLSGDIIYDETTQILDLSGGNFTIGEEAYMENGYLVINATPQEETWYHLNEAIKIYQKVIDQHEKIQGLYTEPDEDDIIINDYDDDNVVIGDIDD